MAQESNQLNLKDQFLLVYILEQLVTKAVHCKTYYQEEIDGIEDYPFVTWSFVNAESPTTSDLTQQYTSIVKIDAHAHNPIDAINIAYLLHTALRTPDYRRFFTQANIVPQKLTDIESHTVNLFGSENYDQDFGFTCVFLVTGSDVYTPDQLNFTVYEPLDIKSATTTDKISSTQTNAGTEEQKGKD